MIVARDRADLYTLLRQEFAKDRAGPLFYDIGPFENPGLPATTIQYQPGRNINWVSYLLYIESSYCHNREQR